jgi:RecA/RadA recombinase
MGAPPLPVLWLCGPAGAGKTTAAWQLFSELTEAGVRAGFADTDQLGMCPSALPGDFEGARIKAQNLGSMIPNYRAAGAQCLIANGVIDPVAGVPFELFPDACVTTCRLRADTEEVVRRFTERNGPSDDVLQDIRDEAAALDQSTFADACVETTNVPAQEVAGLVRAACNLWPGFSGDLAGSDFAATEAAPASGIRAGADGQVMLICGPAGVGKSTVGFQLYLRCLHAGLAASYVDLDQISFVRPAHPDDAGGHRLKARNLAAIWRNYHAAGATHLIATGPIDNAQALQAYAAEIPAALTLCRLRAGRDELTTRILSRGAGGSWPQPGDPLRGQPTRVLLESSARAAEQAAALAKSQLGGLLIDTDGRLPEEAAALIGRTAGWLRLEAHS